MQFKLKRFSKRLCLLILCAITILSSFAAFAASAEDDAKVIEEPFELGEAVCRIKNVTSGLYLDAYRYTAKSKGKAYSNSFDKDSRGQVFHLSPCDDGSFMIIPQNDDAVYAFSYASETSSDHMLKKTKITALVDNFKFDIIEHSSGAYIIAPSSTESNISVLSESAEKSEYGDRYVTVSDMTANLAGQLWIIEPVRTEKLSVIFTATKERLFSTGKYYARKYPYNTYTDDIVWSSSNEDVMMIGADGTWCALGLGKAVITASVDGVCASFTVTVTDKDAFTWYSQNNMYTSDWDATQLSSLYFYADGKKMRFTIDAKEPNAKYCWIDQGCGNCAVAMVLHNMGAVKTSGYDFRSGQTGNLVADPYTVGLANSGNYGADSASVLQYGNPIYMVWSYTAEQFNLDGKTVKLDRIYYPSRSKMRDLLQEHPEGIIIQVSTKTKNHYIVFSECLNPEEKVNSKLKFAVCDSAAYLPYEGDYVLFEESTSYIYEGYRYGNIVSVMFFTTD